MESVNQDWVLGVHLNSTSLLCLARNILMLKVISSAEFNAEDSTDLNYLWDLWYNAAWSKSTVDRFLVDVQELIDIIMTKHDFNTLEAKKKIELKEIFQGWITFLQGKTNSQQSKLRYTLSVRYFI